MFIHHEKIEIQSDRRPTFDNITDTVKETIRKTNFLNGTVLVYSPHTTCSVLIQEASDGQNYWGTEYILQDLVNVLQKIIPTCTSEGQYLHPCQKHIELAAELRDELPSWSLNTDAHLRSVMLGRSVTIPVINGELMLGEFGNIYFADFDQVRARKRTAIIQLMGNCAE